MSVKVELIHVSTHALTLLVVIIVLVTLDINWETTIIAAQVCINLNLKIIFISFFRHKRM